MAAVTSREKRAAREFSREPVEDLGNNCFRENVDERQQTDLPSWSTIAEAVSRSTDLELIEPGELRELADGLAVELLALEPIKADLDSVRYALTEGGEA